MASYTPIHLEERSGSLLLPVRVLPGASHDSVGGCRGGSLMVRVTAPPAGGKANAAVINALSKALEIRKSAIALVSGATARRKVIEIVGVDLGMLKSRVEELAQD